MQRLKFAALFRKNGVARLRNALAFYCSAITFLQRAFALLQRAANLRPYCQDFSKKLSDFGELYTKGTVTIKGAGAGLKRVGGNWVEEEDLVFDYMDFADFEKQNEVLLQYRDALLKVKERGGVTEEFFDVLKECPRYLKW